MLDIEIEKLNVDRTIQGRVKRQMERAQKEYYLNEKIKAIHQELGRKDDRGDELLELKERIEKAGMPKAAREKAEQELKRLEAMPPVSAESTVSRNYIDWLISVPWKRASKELRDLKRAEEILDADHYGLEKIKERILEFLAVRQLTGRTQASILCFVGPPGVGKSSLASSIARATGRRFVRLSLGGVRDEAEIRGHRRTYIGAFPGQIIQMMKKAGTVNPVFLLDEVDKMSMDFRGDPSSALLEVLDPAQNDAFVDHYLDVEYDLSKVMFICTANVAHPIPAPLRDRMEIIHLSGYTPNVEAIAAYRPDLVVISYDPKGLSEALGRLGIPVLHQNAAATLPGAYQQMRQLGKVSGRGVEADRLVERAKAQITRIVTRAKGPGQKASVFIELDPTLYSATSRTFVGRVAALFGHTITDVAHQWREGVTGKGLEDAAHDLLEALFELLDDKPDAPEQLLAEPPAPEVAREVELGDAAK